MGKGKFSPNRPHDYLYDFKYNADKEIPPPFTLNKDEYNERLHFPNYDHEGFDYYGYSAFLADGSFIGLGKGIDRLGYTESDYLEMTDEEYSEVI